MAMTDAQRQQKRRAKLKQQAQQARFDPYPYIGQAVCELAQAGELEQSLCASIQARAVELFTQKQQDSSDGPANQVLMQRYFSTLISSVFSKQE
ncbi:MAG: hypothetical protein K6F05_05140 [Succinivibrio sp.]|nr:hypothetical protein [Succinivibrio sp.]